MRNKRLAAGFVAGNFVCGFERRTHSPRMRTKQKARRKIRRKSRRGSRKILFTERPLQPRACPRDAKWLVWTKSTVDKEKDGRLSNLILSSLTDSTEIELTRAAITTSRRVGLQTVNALRFLSDRKRAGAKTGHSGNANLADQSAWRRALAGDGICARATPN